MIINPSFIHTSVQFSSVQFSLSVVSDSLQPHESQYARPPRPSPAPRVHSDSRSSSQWCHPAISSSAVPFSSCPQSLPASVFSNESTLPMRWPKYWSFSFRIIPSKEIPGLISFRMNWLDLLAVQGTLKSLLQHHSSKASIPTVIKRVIPFRFYIFTTFLCFTLEILWKGHQNIYCIFAKKQNWLRKQHSNHNTGTVILSWTIKISGLCDFVVYIKKKWLFVIIQFLTGCSYNTWNFLRDESNKGIFPYVNEKIW